MIANKQVAAEIHWLMLDISGRINESILNVQQQCSFEEFENYRRPCAKILSQILLEILNPIHQLHPHLMPKGMKEED
jgi:hypothetical protein